VIPIRVPPLRERPEDIRPLVEHFVKQFAREQLPAEDLHARAIERLARTPGAATCASCKNTIERLLIMVEGDEIRPEQLSDVLRRRRRRARPRREAAARSQDFKASAERASWCRSCARTAGTSRPPAAPSARRARTSTRSSSSTDHAGEGR
jgi:DNA-binding NtrC family response regulator